MEVGVARSELPLALLEKLVLQLEPCTELFGLGDVLMNGDQLA